MKYLSLFSGIGGFELGIQQAYEILNMGRTTSTSNTEDRRHLPLPDNSDGNGGGADTNIPECIGFSEIDKYAIQVYQKHFNHKNYGDITKINEKTLPDFDLLVGGFPCQSFSIAGKRGGFEDTRGTMFFEIARIVREKQPRLLLLENVKGLLSHDQGKTFYTIISTLDELGYDCQWQVLNSKNFGVPQNRERVFIVGHLRGTTRPEVFPIGENDKENTKSRKVCTSATVSTRTGSTAGGQQFIKQLNKPTHSNDRVYLEEGLSPTLNTMQGGNRQPFVASVLTPDRLNKRQNGRRIKENGEPSFTLTSQDRHGVMIKEATKKGFAIANDGDSINLSVPNSKTRRGRVGNGVAQTLDTGMQQYTLQGCRIRRLTPIECERLQGFPDNWTEYGIRRAYIDPTADYPEYIKEKISDTQRYKCLGNAVTVNVVEEIIKRLV